MSDNRFALKALISGCEVFCLGGKTEQQLRRAADGYPPPYPRAAPDHRHHNRTDDLGRDKEHAMSTLSAPVRTREQRLAALVHANEVRTARARLKRELKAGDAELARDLIRAPMAVVESMYVEDLLLALPKLGRVKVRRILNQAAVSRSKTLGGLTHRQREALAQELERR